MSTYALIVGISVLYSANASGFGLACLSNIDPNPENLVATGIIKTKTAQCGCLLRLEPNTKVNVSCSSLFLVCVPCQGSV